MNEVITTRNLIRHELVQGNLAHALRLALDAARRNPSAESWRMIHRTFRGTPCDISALFPEGSSLRIAIAASFTAQNLLPYIDVVCLLNGINVSFYVAPFNQFQMEFRDPTSELHRFNPQVTILLAELVDLVGEIPVFQDRHAFDAAIKHAGHAVVDVARAYLAHSAGHLLVHNFIMPSCCAGGAFEKLGIVDFCRSVNADLPSALGEMENVFLVDVDHLASRFGADTAMNPRMRYLARMPLSENFACALARHQAAHFRALCGRTRKCLVVDLDNVMWGGVVGEDGVVGVAIGSDPPGNVYRDVQLAIRRLYERGVILAIASKNNPEDALAVFAERQEMILRREDFAAIEISWGDKASAIRRIAKNLNIGLDSIVFLDDSPQERLLVQTELPEVEILSFPEDICALPDELLRCGLFDTFRVTEEDRRRGRMYAQRQQRDEALASATDLTSFLHSLGIVVQVNRADRTDTPRVAQLTQRTNQFNLTTRRYTEQDIESMLADPDWLVLVVHVQDRFGDEGLIGVSLTHVEEQRGCIDSFLLSCRVLGRGIEQAFLAATLRHVRHAGATRVAANYLPTKKNAQVKDFYSRHGFTEIRRAADAIEYEISLTTSGPEVPDWIRLRMALETQAEVPI